MFNFSIDNSRILQWRSRKAKDVEAQGSARRQYLFSSGREGLFALLKGQQFDKKVVAVPAFIPEGIKYPFTREGWELRPYQLLEDGTIDQTSFRGVVNSADVEIAIVIHYFGVLQALAPIQKSIPENVIVIEDFAHALPEQSILDKVQYSDIQLFSLTKLIGLTDGCLLLAKSDIPLLPAKRWSIPYSIALGLKLISLVSNTIAHHWKSGFTKTIAIAFYGRWYKQLMRYCHQPHAFSAIGKWIWRHSNWQAAVGKRQEYAKIYQHYFQDTEWQSFEVSHAMMGYPISISFRDQLDTYLKRNSYRGTYFEEAWFQLINEGESRRFSEQHYLLPLNQKLKEADIRKIAELVLAFQKEEGKEK